MNASIMAKSALASFLHSSGIISWKMNQYFGSDFAILTYHRIIPKKKTNHTVQAGMVVEPETLNLHIRFLRKYFEIVPLSFFASHDDTYAREKPKKHLCVLTFDDGWYDFYKYAYPILQHYEVPATVFLPTNFIGTNRWFWTDRLGFLLGCISDSQDNLKRSPVVKNSLVNAIVNTPGTLEMKLEKTINYLKNYRIEDIDQSLSELTTALGEDSTPQERAFLTWEEVLEMASSGLVSFGSHTAEHSILTTLTDEEAMYELKKSKDVLISQKIVNPTFISFCYPNGNFTDRLSKMVREAGYHLAVTTQRGWNHSGKSFYTLRRIGIHQDIAYTDAMFGSRIVNLL